MPESHNAAASDLDPFLEWKGVEMQPDQVKRMHFDGFHSVVHVLRVDVVGQMRGFSIGLIEETSTGDVEVVRYCTDHDELHIHLPNQGREVLMPIRYPADVERAYSLANAEMWDRFELLALPCKEVD